MIEEYIKSGDIGPYRACLFDSYCGEPIGWGYPILRHLGEDKWEEVSKLGRMDCAYPKWFLITKYLTREEAIERYGDETDIELGPKGGFKTITFGDKRFCMKELRSNK